MKDLKVSNNIIITHSSQETESLGKNLAKTLSAGDILVFVGDLGSGKTTFIQGLAKGLGIKRRIISPTFIIVRHYKLKSNMSRSKFFYHIDLYRTKSKKDLLGIGLDQIIEDREGIIAIEWGEKLGELMPKKVIEIHLKYLNEDKREISIRRYD